MPYSPDYRVTDNNGFTQYGPSNKSDCLRMITIQTENFPLWLERWDGDWFPHSRYRNGKLEHTF